MGHRIMSSGWRLGAQRPRRPPHTPFLVSSAAVAALPSASGCSTISSSYLGQYTSAAGTCASTDQHEQSTRAVAGPSTSTEGNESRGTPSHAPQVLPVGHMFCPAGACAETTEGAGAPSPGEEARRSRTPRQ